MNRPLELPSSPPIAIADGRTMPGVWLRIFFWLASTVPIVLFLIRPFAVTMAVLCSSAVRSGTTANAARIFSRRLTRPAALRFSRRVVGSFYDFVVDLGRSRGSTAEDLMALVGRVDGREAYDNCRKLGRGCVLVTAHMGSFEVGLAGLTVPERSIHVVFKRDPSAAFESLRSRLRGRLGVHEVPIDDGWNAWLSLRDALLRDEVVVMQGDRAVPGQRSQVVPFLGGHLRIPTGPARLAQLTGSPIVPVSTVRVDPSSAGGRFQLRLGTPIHVRTDIDAASAITEATNAVGRAIETMVAEHAEQWLVLEPAFEEDRRDAH